MTTSPWRLGRVMVLGFILSAGSGCTKPAQVTLYSERHGTPPANQQWADQRGQTNVRAPVPRAKPGRGASGGAVEVAALPDVASSPSSDDTSTRSFDRTDGRDQGNQRAMAPNGHHVVAPKETIYALSRRYGVPVRAIIELNGLQPPYVLHPGQQVRIPAQRTHVVDKGETVYGISRRYEVSINELVRLNSIEEPFTIVLGQTLLLPDPVAEGDPSTTGATTEVAVVTPPPSAVGEAAAPPAGRSERVVLPPTINIPTPAPPSGPGFLWPVDGRVILPFGSKGKGLYNDGINISAPRGTPVRAAQNGVVAYRGNEIRGFGNLILIKHADGYMTAYAHNDALLVEPGQQVKRGQIIARVGSTGSVADPQLHFEIRKGRKPVDPAKYLNRQQAAAAAPNNS